MPNPNTGDSAMAQDPSTTRPRLVPMLSYQDAPAAIRFLCQAFGFEETMRLEMPDGRIGHAELVRDGALVMLASEYPEMGLQSALHHETRYSQLYCSVDDVDAHHAQAKAAGATITSEPEDQDYGDRVYRAVDLEGHRWMFGSPVRSAEGR